MGEGEDRKKLVEKIKSLGLEQTIYLAGFIENAEQYIKGFDLFLFPSIKEGLPYSVLEAMAGECAIVASRVGGIPDLIKDQENGMLVPPKNPAALTQAIYELIQDKAKRESLAIKAFQTAETKFSLHDMIAKTTNIYE